MKPPLNASFRPLYPPFRPVPETVRQIQLVQTGLLAILCLAGVWMRGWPALGPLAAGVTVSVAWIVGNVRWFGRGILNPCGYRYYLITGLLYAVLLPPECAWYLAAAGMVAGHALALLSRVLLRVSQLNAAVLGAIAVSLCQPELFVNQPPAALRGWTGLLWEGAVPQIDLFMTSHLPRLDWIVLANPGSGLGLGCALLPMLCGMYLIYRGYYSGRLTLWFSLAFLAAAALTPALPVGQQGAFWPLWAQGLNVGVVWLAYHFFLGHSIFLAFILPMDTFCRPVTQTGQICFGILAGLTVVMLRLYATALPVPDLWAILFIQLLTPLIDSVTRPR